MTFIGPTVENLETFADKTKARIAAIAANVPVVPGVASLYIYTSYIYVYIYIYIYIYIYVELTK